MNKFTLFLFLIPALSFGAVSLQPRTTCSEEKVSLYKAFVPTDFIDRASVGRDQVEPLRAHIINFITANPAARITDIVVTASSAKLPFYILSGKRKVIDPQSMTRNATLARERSEFALALLREIKVSKSQLSGSQISTRSELGGPDFARIDLNARFVTPMTPGYSDQVRSFYSENKTIYENQALQSSVDPLLVESDYPNLYQVKFKPFQGLRLEISGNAGCAPAKPVKDSEVIRQ